MQLVTLLGAGTCPLSGPAQRAAMGRALSLALPSSGPRAAGPLAVVSCVLLKQIKKTDSGRYHNMAVNSYCVRVNGVGFVSSPR